VAVDIFPTLTKVQDDTTFWTCVPLVARADQS